MLIINYTNFITLNRKTGYKKIAINIIIQKFTLQLKKIPPPLNILLFFVTLPNNNPLLYKEC